MKKIFGDIQLRRRVLFVFGNFAAYALIVGVIVMPIYALFADRDNRIEEQGKVLARLNAISAQATNVQSIVSDTKAQMQGGEFLAGPNENVVNADLQTKLKAMTEAAGARPRAVQALSVKTVDQIRYTGSRIEIFGSLQSILRAIHTIESSKPYLFISGAALKTLQPTRQGGSEQPVIQAQLDIFGAMQVGGQP
jgi:general secretion pathway protein M